MHTIEIPEAKIRRYIPSDLSECDAEQYIAMCQLIFLFQNQEISYDEFRVHAVYKLMKMKPKVQKSEEDLDKFANVYTLSELIDDFFEIDENGQKTIKQYYIHNPVPSFKPLFTTLYGPTDSFMNITFGEYTDGLRLFHDFHATGDMQFLKLLCALFYRPKKRFHWFKKRQANYNGDLRKKYNSATLEADAKKLQHAPIGFVYGFYLLFASFQKYLVDAKIMWGGKELDFSILFNGDGTTDPDTTTPDIGMDTIVFTLAESGVFGKVEEVRNTNFWEILIRMYDLRRADLERKKQEQHAPNP